MNELVELLGLAQPQISKHLRVLREVGVVHVREDGPQRLYRLNAAALRPMMIGNRSAEVTPPGDTQILITREFDAPKELVFRAYTTPELVRRWWHANRGEMTVREIDLRVGGAWRFVMQAPSYGEVAFHGEYREIAPGARTVSTELFEPVPDSPSLNTLTLTERDGRTALTILVEHETKQARDMHVESGMEDGLQDALDLLERVAVELG